MKEDGIPVYEQQHAIYNHRNFRYYIDDKKYNELRRFEVKKDDLIVSCSGTIGKTSLIQENDEKGIISQALLILRVNQELINPKFLKYFLETSKGYNSLISTSGGSSQVNIAKKQIILDIPIAIPSLSEQAKIIKFLDNLNIKIELLEKTLSLYQKTIDYNINEIYSNIKNYDEVKMKNIFKSYSSNLSINKLENNFGKYLLYGAEGVIKSIDFYEIDTKYITIIKDGAGVGRLNLCDSNTSALGTLQCLIPKENYDINFLYFYLKTLKFDKYIVGSTIPHIYFKDYSKEKLKIPTLELQKQIGNYISLLNKRNTFIEDKINYLKLFKKGLLQKMFI